ncbi:hypothetical protein ITI46_21855 [Streptomyces oryzae]|uniref:DUF4345 domain-containing protein n=1 Tax=Streptomyces oryzae TaxID=1434886 RepID=A0ABS3XFX8_9ACTN|nr:hypothetical protein [Streptomyces oryzae]MBO8194284.1 hypothetical protein [Streptomyces oryzae]
MDDATGTPPQRDGVLWAGLLFLAVTQGAAGVSQLLLPKVFYEDFPWVAELPPFNDHLMRDVGAATLAYVLVLAVAATTMESRLVRTALAANLVFTAPHCAYHAFHLDPFSTAAAVSQMLALGLGVVLPALLLWRARRLRPSEICGKVRTSGKRG